MLGCATRSTTHPMVQSPDYKKLHTETVFSVSELKRFFLRFVNICNDQGILELAEFELQPELAFFPLAAMLFQYELRNCAADTKGISFEIYVRILNMISPKQAVEEKFKYLYSLLGFDHLDSPEDQKLSYTKFLKELCCGSIPEHSVDLIVDECWRNALPHNEDKMTVNRFMRMVTVFDIHTLLSINI